MAKNPGPGKIAPVPKKRPSNGPTQAGRGGPPLAAPHSPRATARFPINPRKRPRPWPPPCSPPRQYSANPPLATRCRPSPAKVPPCRFGRIARSASLWQASAKGFFPASLGPQSEIVKTRPTGVNLPDRVCPSPSQRGICATVFFPSGFLEALVFRSVFLELGNRVVQRNAFVPPAPNRPALDGPEPFFQFRHRQPQRPHLFFTRVFCPLPVNPSIKTLAQNNSPPRAFAFSDRAPNFIGPQILLRQFCGSTPLQLGGGQSVPSI